MMILSLVWMETSTTHYLLGTAATFLLLAAGLLLFVLYFLQKQHRRARTKKHLRLLYSDLISEMSLCESESEREEVWARPSTEKIKKTWLTQSFGRKILIKELVKSKDSLTGDAATNLRWLYEKLALDKDSFQRFSSKAWHIKASGIQQLAEMQQAQYLIKIYRETNNRNAFVRSEAQIAVVKLTGFKGLRFLNIVSYPITQWQQLCLLDQLREQDVEPEKIQGWLLSKNDTVVEFALRLTAAFKCYALHPAVNDCLQHSSPVIREQALLALQEIYSEDTTPILLNIFPSCTKTEQWLVIKILLNNADKNGIRLLLSLLAQQNEEMQQFARLAVQEHHPDLLNNPGKEKEVVFPSSLHKKAI